MRNKLTLVVLLVALLAGGLALIKLNPTDHSVETGAIALTGIEDNEVTDERTETPVKSPAFISLKELPYEEVAIEVMGGVELYGRLYDPSQEPESEDEDESDDEDEEALPTEKYPLIILVHQLNGSHRSWDELPARLVDRGYAVLAVDQRGHGASAKRGRGWRTFRPIDWQKLPDDITRMIEFFQGSEDYPQIDGERVGIIGASIGANAAIIAASRNNEWVKALVTLSAGLSYKDLKVTKPIYRYKNALMMVASQNDAYAFESTQILYRLPTGAKSLMLYKNIGHGADTMRFFPQLQVKTADWLARHVPPTPAIIEYPEEEDEEEYDDEG